MFTVMINSLLIDKPYTISTIYHLTANQLHIIQAKALFSLNVNIKTNEIVSFWQEFSIGVLYANIIILTSKHALLHF